MFNLQSPHFSTCSKAELLNRLSPSFRNKRIPSAQDNYSHSNSNLHKNSFRKQSSPSKCSEKVRRSKSKKVNRTTDPSIIAEVNCLKEQYQNLKETYRDMIQERIRSAKEKNQANNEISQLKSKNQQLRKESEKQSAKSVFLQQQIQRIKRECYKLLQVEQFKSLKLQETLQQKQQAINMLLKMNDQHSTTKLASSLERLQSLACYGSKGQPGESLMISQDKPFENPNRSQSQFISISLTSMMDDDQMKQYEISTKRKPQENKENQQNCNLKPIIDPKSFTPKMVLSEPCLYGKDHENLRKVRKELNKKLQINIEDRLKDGNIAGSLKTPTHLIGNQRKNSKLKHSKSKSKKFEDERENQGNRLQKKKAK